MHISDRSPRLFFAPQGDLVKLKINLPACGGGKREVIRGMTRGSRSRMLQTVARLKQNTTPLFVTLTYRDQGADWSLAKVQFRTFVKRLVRAFPGVGLLWKLEFQKRGAPHFHFFLWGLSLDNAREFIPGAWGAVTGGDEVQLAWHKGELSNGNEHCVQKIKSWRGVKFYAAKYITKRDQDQDKSDQTGRLWGVIGAVPFSKIVMFKISMDVALDFKRQYFRWSGLKKRARVGFWAARFHVDWLSFLCTIIEQREEENIPPNFPPGWYRSGLPQQEEI